MKISDLAVEKMKSNNLVMGKLCAAFDRHMKTIETWIITKNIILTTPTAVEIIKEETGLTEEEILVNEKATA